jgi:hypothetical protein
MEKRVPVGHCGKFAVIPKRRTDANDFAHFASSLVAPNADLTHVPAERPPYFFIIRLRREISPMPSDDGVLNGRENHAIALRA